MKKNATRAAAVVIVLLLTGPGQGQTERLGSQTSGIWQLIETREGRTSCWGATIQLNRLHFPASIKATDLEIIEAKHSGELKPLMEWKVDSTRKRLTIRFRPGFGDSGTGNRMEIRIKHQVVDPDSAVTGSLIWALETDSL